MSNPIVPLSEEKSQELRKRLLDVVQEYFPGYTQAICVVGNPDNPAIQAIGMIEDDLPKEKLAVMVAGIQFALQKIKETTLPKELQDLDINFGSVIDFNEQAETEKYYSSKSPNCECDVCTYWREHPGERIHYIRAIMKGGKLKKLLPLADMITNEECEQLMNKYNRLVIDNTMEALDENYEAFIEILRREKSSVFKEIDIIMSMSLAKAREALKMNQASSPKSPFVFGKMGHA